MELRENFIAKAMGRELPSYISPAALQDAPGAPHPALPRLVLSAGFITVKPSSGLPYRHIRRWRIWFYSNDCLFLRPTFPQALPLFPSQYCWWIKLIQLSSECHLSQRVEVEAVAMLLPLWLQGVKESCDSFRNISNFRLLVRASVSFVSFPSQRVHLMAHTYCLFHFNAARYPGLAEPVRSPGLAERVMDPAAWVGHPC